MRPGRSDVDMCKSTDNGAVLAAILRAPSLTFVQGRGRWRGVWGMLGPSMGPSDFCHWTESMISHALNPAIAKVINHLLAVYSSLVFGCLCIPVSGRILYERWIDDGGNN